MSDTSKQERDLADAMKALAECGPKPDMPTDADLKGNSVRFKDVGPGSKPKGENGQ